MAGFKTGDAVRATKAAENHTITGAQPPVCGDIGRVVCAASTKGYYFVRFANNAHNWRRSMKRKPGTTVVVVDPEDEWHYAHMEAGDVGIVVRTRDEDDDWKVDILWLRTGNEDWFLSRHWGEKIRRL